MKLLVVKFLCILLFSSCIKNGKDDNNIYFSRSDFPIKKELKSGEKIELQDALNPKYCYLIRDSLFLISNRDDVNKSYGGLYSLKTGNLIREFASKGQGPKEFISCTLDVRSGDSDIFYLEDVIQNKYWICSIDSIINGSNYLLRSFTYSRDVIRLCPIENEYVGYNFWYLDNDKINNKVNPINKYTMTDNPKGRLGTGHEYFVANVTGGYVFTNKKCNRYLIANFFTDKIEFYNDSLKLIKRMIGPDFMNPEYKKISRDGVNYVFFEKGTSYRAYLAYTITDEHIYLAYEGTNGTPYKTSNLKNVEIFKIDWDGNLLCNYILDKHAFSISVDEKEEYIYACCYDSYDGEIELLKYSMQ